MKRFFSTSKPIDSSEVTPESVYLNRRSFMKSAGAIAAGVLLAACNPTNETVTSPAITSSPPLVDELGNPSTPFNEIINFNNFYEFSLGKTSVADISKDFKTSPWEIEIGGLVHKPGIFSIEDLIRKYPPQERIYRLRCVETWSMVIPWNGFELAALINDVEPMGSAKYVRFETLHDLTQMPGLKDSSYPWPYTEGFPVNPGG